VIRPSRVILARRGCRALPAGTRPMSASTIAGLLPQVSGWHLAKGNLCKTFRFADYHQTMAFVNAVAWIAHREDHHPELSVAFDRCTVAYSTHSVGGISINDFICAAKISALSHGVAPRSR